jgi:peptide deformylase
LAIFPIRLFGDPVLRLPASEVPREQFDEGLKKLIGDMTETMVEAPGVGLAAPQIGVSKRVIVWREDEKPSALVNGKILERKGSVEDEEACLSIPGLRYPISRAQWVKVEGLDVSGNRVEFEAEEMTARVLQHEIDHTDGVLFIDHLPPDLLKEAKRALREQALAGVPTSPSGPTL